MTLASDRDGFLVGRRIDIDETAYERHLDLLREIREDGAAMLDELAGIRKSLDAKPQAVAPARSKGTGSAVPPPRDTGRAVAPQRSASTPVAGKAPEAVAPKATSTRQAAPIPAAKAATARPRRTNGQFGADAGREKAGSERETKQRMDASKALNDAASNLGRGAATVATGASRADPALAAAKEVSETVSPAFGSLRKLFRRRATKSETVKALDKQTNWLRRVWNELRDLNKKPSGGGGGMGLLGMLGGLAGLAALIVKMSGLGTLSKLLGRLLGGAAGGVAGGLARAAGGVAGGLARAAGGLAGRIFGRNPPPVPPGGAPPPGPPPGGGSRLGRLVRGVGRRLPLIGGLIAGGSALYSMFGGGDQTKQERFEGAGSGIGAIVGGLAGSLLGPLGTVVGGAIGSIVGEKVGTWLSTLDWQQIGASITGAWNTAVDWTTSAWRTSIDTVTSAWTAVTDWTKSTFEGTTNFIKESWQKVADLGAGVFKAVGDWFTDNLGAVGDFASQAVDKAGAVAESAVVAVKDAATAAVDKVKEVGGNLYEKAGDILSSGVEKAKEAGSALYEAAAPAAAAVANTAKNAAHAVSPSLGKTGSSARKAELINAMQEGGITDVKSQAALMATVDNETGGFTANTEGLSYSAKRLREIFPKYYKTDADAQRDARNPEAIANRVYGNRMGNKDPGDGYKYRGRGDIQLTGKDQYATMGKRLGLDLVNNPDLALDPKVAPKIAVEFWKMSGADRAAMSGDTDKARRIVNGGDIGLAHTRQKYAEYLPQAQAGAFSRPVDVPASPAPAATAKAPPAAPTAAAATPVPPTPATTATTTAVPAPIMAAPAVPVTVAAKPISYTSPAPDTVKYAPSETPSVKTPVASNAGRQDGAGGKSQAPISQDVADRNIAAIACGGIGMYSQHV